MPFIIDDESTSLSLVAEFPEIKNHYGGHGAYVNMSVSLSPASARFISIDTTRGVGFGEKDDLYLTVEMYCSNPSQNLTVEQCLVLDIKTRFFLNITIIDFDMYTMIQDAFIDSVEIVKDKVGMDERDY
jgi:hypothetical protein